MNARPIPTPPGKLFLGNLLELRHDTLNILVKYSREIGDVVRIRLGPRELFFINNPNYFEHILQKNHLNYTKETRAWNKLRPLFGDGLLTSFGPKWLQQRRTMQPAFHRQRIENLSNIFINKTIELADRWSSNIYRNRPINVAEEMMRLTFRIVTATMFSEDLKKEVDTVYWALTQILQYASQSYGRILDFPLWFPTPRNHRVKSGLKALNKIVYELINKRRNHKSAQLDLLAMLMEARDPETGKGMSDEEIRDQVMTIFMTGHETTALALTWTWYLLSVFPNAEQKLYSELKSVLGRRIPTLEDLQKLKYTNRVFKETLRLYPPIWVFGRKTKEPDVLGEYQIPGGSTVFISPYVMHRNSKYFENPEGFDPDRFTTEQIHPPPPFTYIPFGGGPRLCIGRDFALLEFQIIISILAQQFKLSLLPGHVVEKDPSMTLRPRRGMFMTIEEK